MSEPVIEIPKPDRRENCPGAVFCPADCFFANRDRGCQLRAKLGYCPGPGRYRLVKEVNGE